MAVRRLYSPARWQGSPVRFGQLHSYGHTGGFGAGDRLDPYYGGMWTQGSSAVWVSSQLAAAQEASGLARLPVALRMSKEEARRVLAASRYFGARMAALGVLDQWRTVSAEQLAAFTGWPTLGSPDPGSLVALFTLGVIDRGTFASALLAGANTERATLYRPSRSGAFEEEVAPLLSFAQRVGVTGGSPWDFRRQFDRHNLLSAELGLRAAQWCEVGTVLGEKLSTADLLAGTGIGAPAVEDAVGADLTIVRPDGLRIAVELTASAGKDFSRKVNRWARLLASRSLASSGLVVLFVEAAPTGTEHRHGRGDSVRSSVYRAVAEQVRLFPGTGADRVAERIGVVSWQQWFPGPGLATEEFTRLEVDRPTGDPATGTWERAGLLDVVDVGFDPVDAGAATAVIRNGSMLLGVPHWLRDPADRVELWPALAGRVGWGELPTSPPARPNRTSAHRSPASRGVPGHFRAARRARLELADPV